MTGNMRLVLCWVQTIAIALATVCAVMSSSPTQNHRLVLAGSLAFMIVLNGYIWCMHAKLGTKTRGGPSSRSPNAVTDIA